MMKMIITLSLKKASLKGAKTMKNESALENLKVLSYLERVGKVHLELDSTGSTITSVSTDEEFATFIVPDFLKVDLSAADHETMYGIDRVVIHGELNLSFLKELEMLSWVEIVNSERYISVDGVVYDENLDLYFVPPHYHAHYLELLDTVRRIPSTVSFGFTEIGTLVIPHLILAESDVFSGSFIRSIIAPECRFFGTIKDMAVLEHIEADPLCIYERIERCPCLLNKT